MPFPQIISLISIIILTTLATIIGIQLIFLLKELKTSLGYFNRVLTSAETTIHKIAVPVTSVIGLVEGFKQSSKIIETITSYLDKRRSQVPPIKFDE